MEPDESLRPHSAQYARARAAAAEYTDPAELWEALATRGLIPPGWIDEPRRCFAASKPCDNCAGRGQRTRRPLRPGVTGGGPYRCSECSGTGRRVLREPSVRPGTLGECVAFASNPHGIATAEALAREALVRLAPWGAAMPEVIAWECERVDATPVWLGSRASPPGSLASARRALDAAAGGADSLTAQGAWPQRGLSLWRAAARGGAKVSARELRRVDGAYFESLANPFEPLFRLYCLGYALIDIAPEAVTLVAPDLSPAPLPADGP